MPNQKNIKKLKELKEKISKAKSLIFTTYTGLSANQMNTLKAKVSETNAEVTIAKNTLIKKALAEAPAVPIDPSVASPDLIGQTATIFIYEEPLGPIKALFEFIKETKLPEVKMGIINKVFTTAAQLEILSNLPSKEQLLTQILRGLKSPISGIVNVLEGPQRNFVYALKAISDKKGGGVSS